MKFRGRRKNRREDGLEACRHIERVGVAHVDVGEGARVAAVRHILESRLDERAVLAVETTFS